MYDLVGKIENWMLLVNTVLLVRKCRGGRKGKNKVVGVGNARFGKVGLIFLRCPSKYNSESIGRKPVRKWRIEPFSDALLKQKHTWRVGKTAARAQGAGLEWHRASEVQGSIQTTQDLATCKDLALPPGTFIKSLWRCWSRVVTHLASPCVVPFIKCLITIFLHFIPFFEPHAPSFFSLQRIITTAAILFMLPIIVHWSALWLQQHLYPVGLDFVVRNWDLESTHDLPKNCELHKWRS